MWGMTKLDEIRNEFKKRGWRTNGHDRKNGKNKLKDNLDILKGETITL